MSSFETSPKTAEAVSFQIQKTYNCTTPQVLDLCTRRRSGSESPKPEGAHQPMKNSPEIQEIHSTLPEYIRSSPLIVQFPNSNNNNTLEQRKSPYLQTSIHQTDNIEQFHPVNNNNNFLEHSLPFSLNQFNQTHQIYRPLPLKSDIDSSEEGSVKSDSNEFSPTLMTNSGGKPKVTRPFKAYPKDPFFLALGACTADAVLGKESAEAYAEFRQKMLYQVRANNPEPGVTNTKMRRSTIPTCTQDMDGKDASYWEKRKKNNEAAKRSRDARRAKEDEIAIRAAFLEQENLKLKYEIAALRNENTKFRCLLYN